MIWPFKKSIDDSETVKIRMVVGLGNPGDEYAGTRHNAGFEVIDALTESLGIKVKKKKFGGCVGEEVLFGKKLILLKPMGYMNRSGQVVATAAGFYKLALDDILVVTDDMALDVGVIRLRRKGSAGGHNGLSDIIAKLGSEEFSRLRIGIGKADEASDIDYVLGKFSKEERDKIDVAIERAKNAVMCWLEAGMDTAMNKYN